MSQITVRIAAQPVTPEQALIATKAAHVLTNREPWSRAQRWIIPRERPALIVLAFDTGIGGDIGHRVDMTLDGLPVLHSRGQVRKLDPLPSTLATLDYAEATDEPQMRLVTGMPPHSEIERKYEGTVASLGDGRPFAFSSSDAALIVAFPDSRAIAWHSRTSGGVAPGIASQCVPNPISYYARDIYLMRPSDREISRGVVLDFARSQLTEEISFE